MCLPYSVRRPGFRFVLVPLFLHSYFFWVWRGGGICVPNPRPVPVVMCCRSNKKARRSLSYRARAILAEEIIAPASDASRYMRPDVYLVFPQEVLTAYDMEPALVGAEVVKTLRGANQPGMVVAKALR